MRASIRLALWSILLAANAARPAAAQVVLRGELVCRDRDWPPLRHGLVTLRTSPHYNDITSSTGGFVLHLPRDMAERLRDHHLDLVVYGADTVPVRPLVSNASYRSLRGRGEIWINKIRVDEPCDRIQVSQASLDIVRANFQRASMPRAPAMHGLGTLARGAGNLSVVALPLIAFGSSLPATAADSLNVAAVPAFRPTQGIRLRDASRVAALIGQTAVPSRNQAHALFLNAAAITDSPSPHAWSTTTNWGLTELGVVIPRSPSFTIGAGGQWLRQVESRALTLSTGTTVPATLDVTQGSAMVAGTYRPGDRISMAATAKLLTSRTQQPHQLVTVSRVRLSSGPTGGPPRVDERSEKARRGDFDLSAVVFPLASVGLGVSVINVIGNDASNAVVLGASRGLLAGVKAELGRWELGSEVLAGAHAPDFSLGASARLPGNIVTFAGGGTAHRVRKVGIGRDRFFLDFAQSPELGNMITVSARSSQR